MSRTILVAVFAFFAGLGSGLVAHRHFGDAGQGATRAADLAGIEKLHQADIAATLTQDPASLTALWSDDGVKVDAPGTPVVGVKALNEMYVKTHTDYPDFKVLTYTPTMKEIQIAEDWAIEVGSVAATYRLSATDNPVSIADKGVRVLKRQSDGSWKFAVVGLK